LAVEKPQEESAAFLAFKWPEKINSAARQYNAAMPSPSGKRFVRIVNFLFVLELVRNCSATGPSL
jgi:hypothetical protein